MTKTFELTDEEIATIIFALRELGNKRNEQAINCNNNHIGDALRKQGNRIYDLITKINPS